MGQQTKEHTFACFNKSATTINQSESASMPNNSIPKAARVL